MGPDLLLILLLILLNAFFVAAEFALVKVRSSQVELKANQGNKAAALVKKMQENLDSYLSSCQLGITISSLVLGRVGEPYVAVLLERLFESFNWNMEPATLHNVSFITAITFITLIHMVIGEQVPKTMGIRFAMNTSLLLAYPLHVLTRLGLRAFGLKSSAEHGDSHTEEEIRMLLTESEESGAIKQSEHELIQNVFEFDDRVVKNILVPRTKISALDLELEPQEILDKVIDEGYSRLPVYRENIDNIVGIIFTKDLLKLMKQAAITRENIESLIRPAHFIPQSKRINDLLREFQTLHIQMAIVTSEFGGITGLVTMEDIIEELVGEIQDEYDEEKPSVEKKSDTEFIVNALSAISDVNEVLPIALPESPHYETVSGLLNYLFGRIPAVNEKREFGGYEFLILKRFRHSVESVKMTVLDNGQFNMQETE
jgi:CBS domain containing-hemolysin-like protein